MAKPKATANPPAPKKAPVKAPAPRKSRAKPKTTERSSSPPSAPQKDDSDQSDIEVTSGKQPRQVVNWIQNPVWTSSLITYLTNDPPFRIRLFSDSTADAKQQGRAKLVGKDGKQQQYAVLAAYVFSEDPKEQARYANNPGKYATAVETRFRRRVVLLPHAPPGIDFLIQAQEGVQTLRRRAWCDRRGPTPRPSHPGEQYREPFR
jgi:hypothetical protein